VARHTPGRPCRRRVSALGSDPACRVGGSLPTCKTISAGIRRQFRPGVCRAHAIPCIPMPRSARSSRRRPRCSPCCGGHLPALIACSRSADPDRGSDRLDDEDFDEGRNCWWCGTPSTASTAWCRCTQRRARPGALCRAPAASTPESGSPALFLSTAGTRLWHSNIGLTFAGLAEQAGLTRRSASCRPRIHDLRHSFAVNTVLGWYRDARHRGPDAAAVHLPGPHRSRSTPSGITPIPGLFRCLLLCARGWSVTWDGVLS